MDIGIFDLETSGLYANSSIVLCAVIKPYGKDRYSGDVPLKTRIIRADEYKSWKDGKSNNREIIRDIVDELARYDILVAHNGQYFDKAFLNSACIKYGFEPKLRTMKFIDPVMIARKHMRIARNSLASLIDYLDIKDTKTPIKFEHWMKASLDSNSDSLGYIVKHCVKDVKALEGVYTHVKKLVKSIDENGSAFR